MGSWQAQRQGYGYVCSSLNTEKEGWTEARGAVVERGNVRSGSLGDVTVPGVCLPHICSWGFQKGDPREEAFLHDLPSCLI